MKESASSRLDKQLKECILYNPDYPLLQLSNQYYSPLANDFCTAMVNEYYYGKYRALSPVSESDLRDGMWAYMNR